MRATDIMEFLGDSERRVKEMYEVAGIQLRPSGLGRLLDDAKQLLEGATSDGSIPASVENRARLQSCFLLRDTARALEICRTAGVDLTHHLNMLRLGDVDLGVRGRGGERVHFKDFQYEVYLLAMLLHGGLQACFTPPALSAGDIIIGNGIIVEAKHPSVPEKMHRYAKAFNDNIRAAPRIGILAAGIEDAFGYGQRQYFKDVNDFDGWMKGRLAAVEQFWTTDFVHTIAECDGILGVLQTVRIIPYVGNELQFVQLAIGHVIARPGAPAPAVDYVERVLRAITPDVRVCERLPATTSSRSPSKSSADFRIRVPSFAFRPGDRLGAFYARGDGLWALIYECRAANPEGADMELVREIGPVYEPADVPSLHRQMVACLGRPVRVIYHPGAERWFDEQEAPRPTDPPLK